jgi:hypothetical protein
VTYERVFVGGPAHGVREAVEGDVFNSAKRIEVATIRDPLDPLTAAAVIYERAELADSPGAITYTFVPPEVTS